MKKDGGGLLKFFTSGREGGHQDLTPPAGGGNVEIRRNIRLRKRKSLNVAAFLLGTKGWVLQWRDYWDTARDNQLCHSNSHLGTIHNSEGMIMTLSGTLNSVWDTQYIAVEGWSEHCLGYSILPNFHLDIIHNSRGVIRTLYGASLSASPS